MHSIKFLWYTLYLTLVRSTPLENLSTGKSRHFPYFSQYHHIRKHISFFRVFRKDGPSKKLPFYVILSALLGKMKFLLSRIMVLAFGQIIKSDLPKKYLELWHFFYDWQTRFLFPENMVLPLTQKMKDNLPYRNKRKDGISCNFCQLDVFPKNMISHYVGKWKMKILQNCKCVVRQDALNTRSYHYFWRSCFRYLWFH